MAAEERESEGREWKRKGTKETEGIGEKHPRNKFLVTALLLQDKTPGELTRTRPTNLTFVTYIQSLFQSKAS